MGNKEIIRRIKEHMIVHKLNEPRAVHITEALNSAIEALEEQEANRWIPVSERLPEEGEEVLITNDRHEVHKITWNQWSFEDTKYPHRTYGKTIAWKPLPKPYEESEDK